MIRPWRMSKDSSRARGIVTDSSLSPPESCVRVFKGSKFRHVSRGRQHIPSSEALAQILILATGLLGPTTGDLVNNGYCRRMASHSTSIPAVGTEALVPCQKNNTAGNPSDTRVDRKQFVSHISHPQAAAHHQYTESGLSASRWYHFPSKHR